MKILDQHIRELLEDAHAFYSSFVLTKNQSEDQVMEDLSQPHSSSPGKHLRAKDEARLSALRKFAVDVEGLNKLFERLQNIFVDDETKLLKAFETLV